MRAALAPESATVEAQSHSRSPEDVGVAGWSRGHQGLDQWLADLPAWGQAHEVAMDHGSARLNRPYIEHA